MKTKYSFGEMIENAYFLVMTKFQFPGARLVRHPIHIRGKKSLKLGARFTIGRDARIDMPGDKHTLTIGEDCNFGDNLHMTAYESVNIGDRVLVASRVYISDTSHGVYHGDEQTPPEIPPNDRKLVTKPVIIGDDVWIGENVVVLPGTNIGSGCIVGANAVVNGTFEANSIIVGIPAKCIKRYNKQTNKWEKV